MRTFRFAVRQLADSPGFTVVAVITLALGIGLNTAMFSVLNTFMLRPLPYLDAGRLFRLDRVSDQQANLPHKGPNYFAIEEQSREVAHIAAYLPWGYTISEPGRPAEFRTSLRVSPSFLDVLGITPALGRNFRDEEDVPGGNHVIILSDAYWRMRFGADPNVIGRSVRLGGEPVEIVGVLPANPGGGPGIFEHAAILRPMALDGEERTFNTGTMVRILGRYRPGLTPHGAQAHFEVVAARLATTPPDENVGMRLRAVSLQSTRLDNEGLAITALLIGLSGFVLLIACANLANLLVARAMARSREFAIRSALGASSSQLIRPLAAECVLVAAAGCGLALVLSGWTTSWMSRQFSGDGPLLTMPQDWRVLGFAIGAAVVTACLFGIGPAWFVSRVRVNETLKSGGRGATADPSHHRFRNVLLVSQFAIALVLLAGAAAFTRGLGQLVERETGWNPAPLVTAKISVPEGECAEAECRLRFYRRLRERLAALPGVENVSVDVELPIWGFPGPRAYAVEGQPLPQAGQEPIAVTNSVSPEYFATIGSPIVAGRGILQTDTTDSPRVVLINETMARTLFPEGNAIGRRLRPVGGTGGEEPEWAEIVGIARDVRFLSIAAPPTAFQVYKPLTQEAWGFVNATVRAKEGASTAALLEPFRRVLIELDPDVPALNLMPVPTLIAQSNQGLVTINQLLFTFAGLGLFLAAIGVYGVIARLVTQRTLEIGIRMALGASFGHVVRLVLGSGLRMTLIGAGVGLLGATALTRLLNSQFPGLATNSAVTVGVAAAALLAVSVTACYLPARRAIRVDPLVSMRAE
jgi:putative ABC transport system permease protein